MECWMFPAAAKLQLLAFRIQPSFTAPAQPGKSEDASNGHPIVQNARLTRLQYIDIAGGQ
jgi:hypothetical protein